MEAILALTWAVLDAVADAHLAEVSSPPLGRPAVAYEAIPPGLNVYFGRSRISAIARPCLGLLIQRRCTPQDRSAALAAGRAA